MGRAWSEQRPHLPAWRSLPATKRDRKCHAYPAKSRPPATARNFKPRHYLNQPPYGCVSYLFDRRLTRSASREFYAVYLFSVDMSSVTLTLAFGTTQFEKQFGAPKNAFPRMRAAAGRLQEMFSSAMPTRLNRGPITLGATRRQKLHCAYQESVILSYAPYLLSAMPDESQLVADLQELVRLYTDMVSDPLDVTVDKLVEAVIEPAPGPQLVKVFDFELRPPRKSKGSGKGTAKNRRRYSPESRKVGDAGEQVTLDHERDRLTKAGRPDLADRVVWHAKDADYVGWDITSFDPDEIEIFIEVKASAGKTISAVCLTVNEWEAACDPKRREQYYIYIVTNALSKNPVIERLSNPASYVDSGVLICEPIVYELDLRQADEQHTANDANNCIASAAAANGIS
jgi:hypothetical protein